MADAEAAIAELVGLADLADEEALVAAITRSEQLVVLADQIHTAENSLQNQAGKPVAQVEADEGVAARDGRERRRKRAMVPMGWIGPARSRRIGSGRLFADVPPPIGAGG